MKRRQLVIAMVISLVLIPCSVCLTLFRIRYAVTKRGGLFNSLVVPSDVLDLGILDPSKSATATFPISNHGSRVIHILNIFGSCGCTQTGIDRNVLQPGESATVHIIFDPSGYYRRVTKDIIINSDAPNQNVATVAFSAYIPVGIRVDVDNVDLGQGRFGDKLQSRIVRILRDPLNTPESVSVSGDRHSLGIRLSPWQLHGDVEEATVEIDGEIVDDPVGTATRQLVINVGPRHFPVQVTFHVDPVVSADVGNVELNSQAARVIHLFSRSRFPIEFETADSCYGKCLAILGEERNGQTSLTICQATSNPTDFDIVLVKYHLKRADRAETLVIPVSIMRNTTDPVHHQGLGKF